MLGFGARRRARRYREPAPHRLTEAQVAAWRELVAECNEALAQDPESIELADYCDRVRRTVIQGRQPLDVFLLTHPPPWRRVPEREVDEIEALAHAHRLSARRCCTCAGRGQMAVGKVCPNCGGTGRLWVTLGGFSSLSDAGVRLLPRRT